MRLVAARRRRRVGGYGVKDEGIGRVGVGVGVESVQAKAKGGDRAIPVGPPPLVVHHRRVLLGAGHAARPALLVLDAAAALPPTLSARCRRAATARLAPDAGPVRVRWWWRGCGDEGRLGRLGLGERERCRWRGRERERGRGKRRAVRRRHRAACAGREGRARGVVPAATVARRRGQPPVPALRRLRWVARDPVAAAAAAGRNRAWRRRVWREGLGEKRREEVEVAVPVRLEGERVAREQREQVVVHLCAGRVRVRGRAGWEWVRRGGKARDECHRGCAGGGDDRQSGRWRGRQRESGGARLVQDRPRIWAACVDRQRMWRLRLGPRARSLASLFFQSNLSDSSSSWASLRVSMVLHLVPRIGWTGASRTPSQCTTPRTSSNLLLAMLTSLGLVSSMRVPIHPRISSVLFRAPSATTRRRRQANSLPSPTTRPGATQPAPRL